jgi:aspartate-semialdehyde dehydrogenase
LGGLPGRARRGRCRRRSAIPRRFEAAGLDEVLVGRTRRDPSDPNTLVWFLSSDNLRKGAALNAVQVAERLVSVVSSR